MLLTIMSSEILVWIKDMALERATTDETQVYWRKWEVHVMMILSLSFQYFLVISGHFRKRKIGGFFSLVSSVVYLTYLLADLIATITLSALLRAKVESNKSLVVLWTPFLLWHLGSPYNVTAYSLEDNQIWIRHLLGYVIHVSEALYISYNFGIHADTTAKFMAAPILIVGLIKYGERVYSLRSASDKQLVDRLFFGEGKVIKGIGWRDTKGMKDYLLESINKEQRFLRNSYLSFMLFRPLFFGFSAASHTLKNMDPDILHALHKSPEDSFKAMEIELALLYDSLYTKIPIHIKKFGNYSNALSVLSAIFSLSVFSFVIVRHHHRYDYGAANIFLSYLLLLGAILLECLSTAMRFFSTWSLVKASRKLIDRLPILRARLRHMVLREKKMSMGQHDLIEQYCLGRSLTTFLDPNNMIRILWTSHWEIVDADLKTFIHSHVTQLKSYSQFLSQRSEDKLASDIIERYFTFQNDFGWITELATGFVEFIFVFHLATNILYNIEVPQYPIEYLGRQGSGISKRLSDYMMYLLLVRPGMLPMGIADVINKDTYIQSKVVYDKSKASEVAKIEYCNALYSILSFASGGNANPNDHPAIALLDIVQEHLFNSTVQGSAILLSRMLRNLSLYGRLDYQEKWERISHAWADLLAYAAIRCSWKEHAQHLKEGGELLTYVALLMAHLGYSTA